MCLFLDFFFNCRQVLPYHAMQTRTLFSNWRQRGRLKNRIVSHSQVNQVLSCLPAAFEKQTQKQPKKTKVFLQLHPNTQARSYLIIIVVFPGLGVSYFISSNVVLLDSERQQVFALFLQGYYNYVLQNFTFWGEIQSAALICYLHNIQMSPGCSDAKT